MNKKISITIVFSFLLLLVAFFIFSNKEKENKITNFSECELAGNPIMETYPRQCMVNSEIFIEEIEEEPFLENKEDLIILENPQPETNISSPLTITGKARGNWFFEADFPIILTNWDGLIIAETHATALGDWMTEDFVPFEAVLEFAPDTEVSNRGHLILQKDNPSGLPENDDALEITVFFE
jgi:hypothetical protein